MDMTVIYIGVTLSILQIVAGETWFELKLKRFANPSGRESDGDCCDFPCSDPCDPILTVCFDKPDTGECALAIRYTGHYHANVFNFGSRFENGAENPMSLKVTEPWPITLYITMKVEDRDALNANDHMGKIRKTFSKRPSRTRAAALWNHMTFIYKYQTITAEARVFCADHYFNDDCTVYCEPQDNDWDGHFECSLNGTRICLPDYYGPNCTTRCIPSDTDEQGHYTCDNTGQQICLTGWKGANCTEDIDECSNDTINPCSPRGDCINTKGAYTCNCTDPDYTGDNCGEFKRFCDNAPCSNHSKCINDNSGYTCRCNRGWTGDLCDARITACTRNPCRNNGLCTLLHDTYACTCLGTWRGPLCEIAVYRLTNDSKVFYLEGNLPETQWDDLNNGLRSLLKDIGLDDVTIETVVTYPSEKQTKVDIFIESRDPRVRGSLNSILGLPEEEVNTGLILPLSDKQEVIKKPLRVKPDPWVKKHWYVVLVIVLVIIAIIVVFVSVFYRFKRKRISEMEKSGFDNPAHHSVTEALPDAAAGFDNTLYYEVNQPDKVKGLPIGIPSK